MARTESDKEDLIRDATAFVQRGEFVVVSGLLPDTVSPPGPGPTGPAAPISWRTVTIGFRRNGSGTVYLEQDPFYQFDADGRLRRAFEGNFLYRSQTHTLARLHRERSAHNTVLHRHDLSPADLLLFRDRMTQNLQTLLSCLRDGTMACQRAVSSDADFTARSIAFLETVLHPRSQFLSQSINQRS